MNESSFLDAIAAQPDDDAVRVVYADWLEENGQSERAEFVRVQVELAGLPVGDERNWDLCRRERQLLWRHGKHWARPLRRVVRRWHFRRGFVEGVVLPARDFLKHSNDLFQLAPIRHVRLTGIRGVVKKLAGCKALARVRGLDLRHNDVGTSDLEVLLGSRHLTGLTALGLRGTLLCGAEGWRFLAKRPELARLTRLDLGDSRGEPLSSRPSAMQALVKSPHLGSLTSLSLAGYRGQFTSEVGKVLASSDLLARLTELDLSDSSAWGEADEVGLLAASPKSSRLEVLHMRSSGLGRAHAGIDLRGLSKRHHLANLRLLDLRGRAMDASQSKHLGRAKDLSGLAFLNLDRTDCDLGALAGSTALPGLRCLSFDQNSAGTQELEAFARSPLLGQLRSLSLQGQAAPPSSTPNEIGSVELREGEGLAKLLASTPRAARLWHLDLGNQLLGDDGVIALAASPHLGALRSLGLWHNQIGPRGVKALLDSKHLAGLTEVDLRSNPLTAAAHKALRQRFGPAARYGPGRLPVVRTWDDLDADLDEEFDDDDFDEEYE
jgi:uncharacterized protein (TIGR02996 family)